MTNESPPFLNPYPGLRREDDRDDKVHRINVDVAREDTDFIRAVTIDHGSVTTILKMFIKYLSNECRRHKWTHLEQDELINLVRERCTPGGDDPASLQRSAESFTNQRPNGDDGRGVGVMGSAAESNQDQHAAQSDAEEREKDQKPKRRAKTKNG